PMAMPSSTAMVLNSLPTPPASSIAPATSWPMSLRWTWPGTNWVKELAIATIGLPKSPSPMPVARQRALAPAMLRPSVLVWDRSCGMAQPYVARPSADTPSHHENDAPDRSRSGASLLAWCWAGLPRRALLTPVHALLEGAADLELLVAHDDSCEGGGYVPPAVGPTPTPPRHACSSTRWH